MGNQLTQKFGLTIEEEVYYSMKKRNVFAFITLFFLITGPSWSETGDAKPSDQNLQPLDNNMPLKEISDFVEVFQKIKKDYVESLSDGEIMEKALQGLSGQLDPHSSFLNKRNYTDLKENTSGKFGGIGIEIGLRKDAIVVISPVDNSPAKTAGILPGDIITKVDNSPISNLGIENAAKKIKGSPGSRVKVTIRREGEAEPLNFEIIRSLINNKSVSIKQLTSGIMYIRISQFQTSTGEALAKEMVPYSQDPSKKVEGIILDLRNNPGGVLSSAVAVSDAFLKKGMIVYTKGRDRNSDQKYSASIKTLADNTSPMIVLINEGSASASEIVAGALQDNQRAVIVGRTSFGKGSVQTIYPMRNKTAIKLTTALYYTPAGRSIQATGIVPDIRIEKLKLDEDWKPEAVKEANLDRHISSEKKKLNQSSDINFEELAKTDFELYQTVKLLKAVMIHQEK